MSVNGVPTRDISSIDLERMLCAGLTSFEVINKATYDGNNNAATAAATAARKGPKLLQPSSKEELSMSLHGFYAKGFY